MPETNSLGNDITRDYMAAIVHVQQQLQIVHERVNKMKKLSDVKNRHLQQGAELQQSDKDVEDVMRLILRDFLF